MTNLNEIFNLCEAIHERVETVQDAVANYSDSKLEDVPTPQLERIQTAFKAYALSTDKLNKAWSNTIRDELRTRYPSVEPQKVREPMDPADEPRTEIGGLTHKYLDTTSGWTTETDDAGRIIGRHRDETI